MLATLELQCYHQVYQDLVPSLSPSSKAYMKAFIFYYEIGKKKVDFHSSPGKKDNLK